MTEIITRYRHETRRRSLTVSAVMQLTPHMRRITFSGADLHDFKSLGADDHIKLFLPAADGTMVMRDYTPRAFDTKAQTLTVDFALHQAGPATAWAMAARQGDALQIGGPRGSTVIAPVFDWWLLIADETGLPAVGRRLQELGAGTDVITLGIIPDAADRQVLATSARHTAHWLIRPEQAADDPGPVVAVARDLVLPQGRGFIWIAAEAKVARALRDHFRDMRGHPAAHIKAAGYWMRGQADAADTALD